MQKYTVVFSTFSNFIDVLILEGGRVAAKVDYSTPSGISFKSCHGTL